MYFYVFIDPEIVPEAASHGELGLGRLVDILRDFYRGCIVSESDTWEIGEALAENIVDIPDDFQNERKLIGELVIQLFNRGPWVMLDTRGEQRPFVEVAVECGNDERLDLLLSPFATEPGPEDSWEICSITNYHGTTFCSLRDRIRNGRSFAEGESDFDGLFAECFEKLLYHASKIVITDYALGAFYNNEQPINLKRWVRWINRNVRDPNSLTVQIKTDPGDSRRSLETDVRDLQNEIDFTLELEFTQTRVHRRFLSAESSCLNIDRGIDICDREGGCREVGISYENDIE